MISWWKRLVYSLVSVLAAVIVTCTFSDLRETIGTPNAHFNAGGLLGFVYYALILSFLGWLLAVPIVLVATNIRGWRFWMYWAIGSGIGPVVILGIALYAFLTSPRFSSFAPGSIEFVYLAAAVSTLTTLIYLLLMQGAQRRSSRRTTKPSLVG